MNRYPTLKGMFEQHYPITITQANAQSLIRYCRVYEVRQDHPSALNGPQIGTFKMYFLPRDQQALFDEFDINRTVLVKHLAECQGINADFKVISDPYNVLTMWIVHRAMHASALSKPIAEELISSVLKMLHYKFMTSRVNRLFPHGANPEIMAATIEGLSGKFDLTRPETDTWRKLITKTSADVVAKTSIHIDALRDFSPDDRVLRVISDIQTRMRNRLALITDAFYARREQGERIGRYGISDEIDGEQLIRSVEARYEQMITKLTTNALSVDAFIHSTNVTLVCKLVRGLREDTFRRMLIQFSAMAVTQKRRGHELKERHLDDMPPEYIGYQTLLQHLLTITYNAVLHIRGLNLNSKLAILEKVQHQYKASRISDQGIITIKENLMRWIDDMNISSREETKGALRLAFILYIILESFDNA